MRNQLTGLTRAILFTALTLTSGAAAQSSKPAAPPSRGHEATMVKTLLATPKPSVDAAGLVKEVQVRTIVSVTQLALDDGTTVSLRGLAPPTNSRYAELGRGYLTRKVLGKRVRVETDKPPLVSGARVFVSADGSSLNENMLRYGYATCAVEDLTSRTTQDKFLAAQTEAETKKQGLWEKMP